ncbi:MAG: hypothetical protein KDC13_02885 [Bacteroidetes bacterium]|nr:hypothetical protein [Bacteroidota bacterium]
MNKEEIRAFKLFMERINTASGNRKVITLFDLIRRNRQELSNNELLSKMEGVENLNALYQLKNRLRKYLDHSQHTFFFARNPESEALQLYQLGKEWFSRQEYELARDYFEKAGKIAEEHQFYDVLELVYSGLINASMHLTQINPQDFIDKRKQNLRKLTAVKSLDELLTGLNYKLTVSQQTGSADKETTTILKQAIEDFTQVPELRNSAPMRLRLTEGIARLLLQQHEYSKLADYLEENLKMLNRSGVFTAFNHDAKLKLLTWKTNALFKSGKISESLKSAEGLREAMMEYDEAYYDKYFIFYNSALIYANSVLNLPEAIRILRDTIRNPLLQKHPLYGLIVHLNLALCLFEDGQLKPAMKQIASVERLPAYNQADDELKLKIEFSELIMRAEGDEWDTVLLRGRQIARDYSTQLEMRSAMKELLSILLGMAKKDGELNTQLKSQVKKWLNSYQKQVPESQVIDMFEWVKSRLSD